MSRVVNGQMCAGTRVRAGLLILLTASAGCVDAIAYLGLGHVFTANMTGNVVLLGLALGQAHLAAALRTSIAVAGFAVGAGIGAVITDHGEQRPAVWPFPVTAALLSEWVALLGLVIVSRALALSTSRVLDVLTAVTAAAMGIQTIAATKLGVFGISTTVITRTLAGVLDLLVKWLGRVPRNTTRQTTAPDEALSLQLFVLVAYGTGAAIGAWLEQRVHMEALWLPVIVVLLIAATAWLYFGTRCRAGETPPLLHR